MTPTPAENHHTTPAESHRATQPTPPRRNGPWRDQLVDLHVLAENGDPDAAATARRWLAEDPEARRAWNEVQDACDQIHNRDEIHEGAAPEANPSEHTNG